jgi:hypothetical protein
MSDEVIEVIIEAPPVVLVEMEAPPVIQIVSDGAGGGTIMGVGPGLRIVGSEIRFDIASLTRA